METFNYKYSTENYFTDNFGFIGVSWKPEDTKKVHAAFPEFFKGAHVISSNNQGMMPSEF